MTALIALVFALLERVPALRFRPARLLRAHLGTDLVYMLTGFVIGGALGLAYVRGVTDWLEARLALGAALWAPLPFALQVLLALVAIDLGNYAVHALLHWSDFLWEFHKAHHSSRQLDWAAAFRSHVGEQLLRRVLAPLLLIATGAPAGAVGVAGGIFLAWAILNHANLRVPLGPLEAILVTPGYHRVHHVAATSERNLGTVLTCWDRLAGRRLVSDPPPDAVFGLPRETATYPQTWGAQLVAPLRARRPLTLAARPATGAAR
jgi:sterol desaturase/sphingolipid hydroxylase (fatty acid hydroxylase superfamily)